MKQIEEEAKPLPAASWVDQDKLEWMKKPWLLVDPCFSFVKGGEVNLVENHINKGCQIKESTHKERRKIKPRRMRIKS